MNPLAPLRRWWLRHRQYRGGADVLDALYDRPDPWNLASAVEARRFEATSALIREACPDVASILEIGCGEGLQTRRLLALAGHVTGIDVSEQAVARARPAAPEAVLLVGELGDLPLPRSRYDVATLCEVLYYMPDPAGAVALAQRCAAHLVVTIYAPQAHRLAPLLQGNGWREASRIAAEGREWRAWIWSAP